MSGTGNTCVFIASCLAPGANNRVTSDGQRRRLKYRQTSPGASLGIFFGKYGSDHCCFCGAAEKLTGEQKFKASALKSRFNDATLVVASFAVLRRRPSPN